MVKTVFHWGSKTSYVIIFEREINYNMSKPFSKIFKNNLFHFIIQRYCYSVDNIMSRYITLSAGTSNVMMTSVTSMQSFIEMTMTLKLYLNVFYHIWSWWPSWSCDQYNWYTFWLTYHKESSYEI